MIVEEVVGLIVGLVTGLVGLLPTCAGLGVSFTGLSGLSSFMSTANVFVDLPTAATVAALVMTVEVAMNGPRAALWLWRLTPLSG